MITEKIILTWEEYKKLCEIIKTPPTPNKHMKRLVKVFKEWEKEVK